MDHKISKQCNLQFTKSCENSEQTSHILNVLCRNLAKYYCNIIAAVFIFKILTIIDIFVSENEHCLGNVTESVPPLLTIVVKVTF